jgi:DNA repair protein RadD
MIKLRDYQETLVSDIRESFKSGNRRVLAVGPCGMGKTNVFSYIAAGVYKSDKRVLIIAHRKHLLRQISETLKRWGVRHSVVAGGARGIPRTNVVVASVFTVAARLKHWPAPDLIIGDEAHHFTPDSTWGKVVAAFPKARVLGVTATPERADGTGLGLMFDSMVVGPTVRELIDRGFLSEFEVYAPPAPDLTKVKTRAGDYAVGELEKVMGESSVTGDAVKHYLTLCPGKKAIAFCVSVKHAEQVAEAFKMAGVPAECIHGGMEQGKIAAVIDRFSKGSTRVMTSCDLVSEGFDVPSCEVAILLRPTKSYSLFAQQAQRATRIAPGKAMAYILDHANNTRVHGFVDDDREWELTTEKADKRGKGEQAETVRTCPECFAAHRPMPECPKCGHVYQVKAREVKNVEGNLEKLERGEKGVKQVDWQRQYYQLVRVAERRGVGNPKVWAFNIVCNQEAKRRAGKRDVFGEQLINGLTASERNEIRERTMGA